MAKLDKDSPLSGASGKLGGIVLRNTKNGTTVSIKPGERSLAEKRKRISALSPLKKISENRFGAKVKLSRIASKCPEVASALKKYIKDGQDVYHFLLSNRSAIAPVKTILDAAKKKYKWEIR